MRAGWFFCKTSYDPITMDLTPDWPAGFTPTTLRVKPYDIRVLRALPAPFDHVHFVQGTEGRINDELRATDPHEHDIQYYAGAWRQFTRYGIEHDHTYLIGGVDDVRFLPDYFLLWIDGDDAEIDILATAPAWAICAEAEVTEPEPGIYLFGALDTTPWDAPTRTLWETRYRVAFGLDIPPQITNGDRLVSWFAPMCAPNMYDWWTETLFRPAGRT